MIRHRLSVGEQVRVQYLGTAQDGVVVEVSEDGRQVQVVGAERDAPVAFTLRRPTAQFTAGVCGPRLLAAEGV